MSTHKQGFCLFKNFSCQTYKCCGYCSEKKCEYRCKDNPNQCKYFSNEDPRAEIEHTNKLKPVTQEVAVRPKKKKEQTCLSEDQVSAAIERQKEARRLRRLKRKQRKGTV